MNSIQWTWDEEKARLNFQKHEIAFSEAVLVLSDPLQASRPDPHPDGDRWQTLGHVGPFLVFVVHTLPLKWRSESAMIGRIISARIATSNERKAYENGDF